MVMIDVLHCMDLGCTQEILGNLFYEALGTVCKGRNKKEQCNELWQRIRDFYTEFDPTTKLQNLTVEMVKQPGKGPKLRAKGAETRHLAAFGVLLSKDLHNFCRDDRTLTMHRVASALFDLYCLFAQQPVDKDAIAEQCRRLCLLYATLSEEAEAKGVKAWLIKPKFHMMMELCEFQVQTFGSPEDFWAYADESFVGFVAEFSSRRGGVANATSSSLGVLSRYRCMSTS